MNFGSGIDLDNFCWLLGTLGIRQRFIFFLAVADDERRMKILPFATVKFEKADLFGIFRKWCLVPNVRDAAGEWECSVIGVTRHWGERADCAII